MAQMADTDGALVIGACCPDEDCEWEPVGTDGPDCWRLVEQFRREHEDERYSLSFDTLTEAATGG